MKRLSPLKHIFAYFTLGLLVGWYYVMLIVYPLLLYFMVKGSIFSGAIFTLLITLSLIPLPTKPWLRFQYCWIWEIWRDYFDFSFDNSSLANIDNSKKHMVFEFPHGIFPMGQVIAASVVDKITPGKAICGIGADIVFAFPVIRHVMAWIGTLPAKRSNITKILNRGDFCAVIPGGIAEMYLMNSKTESIYFRKRFNTVKAAIQEGANIVPIFCFGNTKIFTALNETVNSKEGKESFLSRFSRKFRASIVFFYGRHYLPVPYRHPIKLVTGEIVEVTQISEPTPEQVQEVMEKVIQSIQRMYEQKKPDWETRPLIIT